MSGEHAHPEIGALDTEVARLNDALARLTAQVVAGQADTAARFDALEGSVGFTHDFEGYIGTTWTVPKDFTRIPGTRWVANKGGLLLPTIYLNIDYELLNSAEDAILRIQVMRENPSDATGKYDIVLPKGRTATFDSRIPAGKKWTAGRPVHVQARVLGPAKWCKIYKTSYAAYSVVT